MSEYHCRACNVRITVDGLGDTRNSCAWCHASPDGRDISARGRALLEGGGPFDVNALEYDDATTLYRLARLHLVDIDGSTAKLTNDARNLLREVDRFSKFGR